MLSLKREELGLKNDRSNGGSSSLADRRPQVSRALSPNHYDKAENAAAASSPVPAVV